VCIVHELSLCGAIADIASRRAGERRVTVVHLQIGQLRQVVPKTLCFCWEMLVADTSLEGSTLDVERIDAVLRCEACGADTAIGDLPAFACGACGGLTVNVVCGEEFAVTALDLAPV
jgi:hydrogenase nickel incorporation protein HypA/HybF